MICAEVEGFQSTLPVRGATYTVSHTDDLIFISIHAPRAGSDENCINAGWDWSRFQSTLPVRGATWRTSFFSRSETFQSTLPVRGATYGCRRRRNTKNNFNPRSPCGERHDLSKIGINLLISIHAPRAGSDTPYHYIHCLRVNFNPRSPCGERLGRKILLSIRAKFQSTLPVRGATLLTVRM